MAATCLKRAFVLLMLPAVALADQIILKDGTEISGQLVAFEHGSYTVKIGRFTKTIPDEQVQDVRMDGARTARATPSVAASPAAAPPPAAHHAKPAPAGEGGPTAVASGQQVQSVLDGLGVGGDSKGTSDLISQILGNGGNASPGDLTALQNNPMMDKVVSKFHDKAYQKSLMESLAQNNPGVSDQLKSLFDQLNSLGGPQAPRDTRGR